MIKKTSIAKIERVISTDESETIVKQSFLIEDDTEITKKGKKSEKK